MTEWLNWLTEQVWCSCSFRRLPVCKPRCALGNVEGWDGTAVRIWATMLSCSVMSQLFARPWTVACQAPLSIGVLQARILEWPAMPSSRGSSQPRDRIQVSHVNRQILYCLSHQGSPRILEWVAYPFSRASSQPRNRTGVSCIAGGFFTSWASREARGLLSSVPSLSRVWLCNPMNCSMPGFPVHYQLLKPPQTHVHRVSDDIQPSHPLSSPSPTFNLSQHQGLFQWVCSSHQVARVLEFQLQHQSFQWIFRTDFL